MDPGNIVRKGEVYTGKMTRYATYETETERCVFLTEFQVVGRFPSQTMIPADPGKKCDSRYRNSVISSSCDTVR